MTSPVPPPTSAFSGFWAARHARRRLEHLCDLRLPVHDRTVLELGAGVGEMTTFFLDRGCHVTAVEPRAMNFVQLQQNLLGPGTLYPESRLRLVQASVEEINPAEFGSYDIVFCYGLLYHLTHWHGAITKMSALCRHFCLIETKVLPNDRAPSAVLSENPEQPTSSIHGPIERHSRLALFEMLTRAFPHAYVPTTQPAIPAEFPCQWHPDERTTKPGSTRCVMIGAHAHLSSDRLLTQLPDRQVSC